MSKVALAYSGSLDTTLAIHWLKEHHNAEVIALAVDVGIQADLVSLGDRAIRAGASSAHILDLRDTFCQDFVAPALKAGLRGPNGDPFATAIGRPAICKALVDLAREHGAPAIAHACKPGGDDIIRFENELHALDPGLEVINPIQEWHFKDREQKLRYARTHNLPLDFTQEESEWSLDGNLWGLATLIGELDDTWEPAPARSYRMVTPRRETLNEPLRIIIEFNKGLPVSINNNKMSLQDLLTEMNDLGSTHGIGHIDIVYHRLNGMKTRKIIECPGATILLSAHEALEEITLDRETSSFKKIVSERYQDLVGRGLWFSQLREALDACVNETQRWVNGEVRLELFRGSIKILGRRSPHSLYQMQVKGPSGKWLRPAKIKRRRSSR